ncbi:MAG: hypothetical protein U0325_29020 [Polyangiales bacterium]
MVNRKALHDAMRAAFDDEEELAATNAKTMFHQTKEQGRRAEVRQVGGPASRLGARGPLARLAVDRAD